uniref:Uncharacterized protein n=1 Tax=Triticum urartu TaxID=4572 RepID=A0A8R7URW6_TRIUA
MGSTWVEHRGSWPEHASVWRVNRYVINMLGKAVMVEQTEKERLNLLLQSYWSAYYVECDIAVSTNINMCREYLFFHPTLCNLFCVPPPFSAFFYESLIGSNFFRDYSKRHLKLQWRYLFT